MAEKVSSRVENSPQQQFTAPEPKSCTQHHEIAKSENNGGLQAWLAVLALFCVFINSWSVLSYYIDVYYAHMFTGEFLQPMALSRSIIQLSCCLISRPRRSPGLEVFKQR